MRFEHTYLAHRLSHAASAKKSYRELGINTLGWDIIYYKSILITPLVFPDRAQFHLLLSQDGFQSSISPSDILSAYQRPR